MGTAAPSPAFPWVCPPLPGLCVRPVGRSSWGPEPPPQPPTPTKPHQSPALFQMSHRCVGWQDIPGCPSGTLLVPSRAPLGAAQMTRQQVTPTHAVTDVVPHPPPPRAAEPGHPGGAVVESAGGPAACGGRVGEWAPCSKGPETARSGWGCHWSAPSCEWASEVPSGQQAHADPPVAPPKPGARGPMCAPRAAP